jgi:hypothetical protein
MSNFFEAFISYGRANSKAFATKLHARLLEQGLRVWFDQNDIPLGVVFEKAIPPPVHSTQIPNLVLKIPSHIQTIKTFNNISFDKLRGTTLLLNDNNAYWVC